MVAEQGDEGLHAKALAAQRRSTARVIEQVTALLLPILQASGLVLDRVEYGDFGRQGLLQVFIDKPVGSEVSGVTIEECVDVSRQLSAALDVQEVMARKYTLEVSSPGLTRPLKKAEDYDRFVGRLAVLTLRRAIDGRRQVLGVLKGREGEAVVVEERKSGAVVRIPLDAVAKARLEVEMQGGR